MNSHSNVQDALLTTLADAFQKIKDPRDPRGVRHDFHGMVVVVFLGLLARITKMAHIQRWAKDIGTPSASHLDSNVVCHGNINDWFSVPREPSVFQ